MTSTPPAGGPPPFGRPAWDAQPTGPDPRAGAPAGPGGATTALRPSQAPTRSNRAVIVTILIVVLAIGGGLSAWLLSTPSFDRSTPRGAAEAFASAVNNRDFDAIDQLVCSEDRYEVRPGSEVVQLLSQVTLQLNGVESEGDTGTADYTATVIIGGGLSAKAPLQRDDGSGLWTVCLPDDLDR